MITSNTFDIEWPPRSGKQQSFPEVDKGGWFEIPAATQLINPAQAALLEELAQIVSKS
jgi:predicted NUDIX family NTP pyrophosphohydrolase